MEAKVDKKLKPMGLTGSILIYISAAMLMFTLTRFLIPFLHKVTEWEIILFWFLIGALGIFLPLIVLGIIILKREGYSFSRQTWMERLRFRKLTRDDLVITFKAIFAVLVLTFILQKGLEAVGGKFENAPAFMYLEPLSGSRLWILAAWAPYWIFNIMGEEFIWRGVMLPRQEPAFGKHTWIIHGFGWWLFHIAFGMNLLITLIPLIFIQSWVVQKTKNSWTGVIMHGGINGPAFIAISLGLI